MNNAISQQPAKEEHICVNGCNITLKFSAASNAAVLHSMRDILFNQGIAPEMSAKVAKASEI